MRTDSIDSAALRNFYLQRLGISVYVPRDAVDQVEDLPSQFGSNDAHSNLSSLQSHETPALQNVVPQPRKPLLEVLDDAVETSNSKQQHEIVATKSDATSAPTSHDTTLLAPFQMLYARLSPAVAIVVQIPSLSKPTLQAAEVRLLGNMLKWLQLGLPEQQWLSFRWPLPGFPLSSVESAAASLHAFLQQAVSANTLQHFLVLGQAPAYCLQRNAQTASISKQCWCTHSLAELLAVPTLKREVWLQLQPLQQALG